MYKNFDKVDDRSRNGSNTGKSPERAIVTLIKAVEETACESDLKNGYSKMNAMGKIVMNRQQKRKFIRQNAKNIWYVSNWQKMRFEREEVDGANQSRTVDIWVNDIYLCVVREYNDITHLSIKRHDISPIHNWQHLQQIKNDICGEEREGLELYPSMSRIVDTCNQYHLWVLKKGRIDVGFKERAVLLRKN